MKHTASARFWRCYDALPSEVRALADKNFQLLKADPSHPSAQLKLLGGGKLYSARVGLHYRTLGLPSDAGVHWFWARMQSTTASSTPNRLLKYLPSATVLARQVHRLTH